MIGQVIPDTVNHQYPAPGALPLKTAYLRKQMLIELPDATFSGPPEPCNPLCGAPHFGQNAADFRVVGARHRCLHESLLLAPFGKASPGKAGEPVVER